MAQTSIKKLYERRTSGTTLINSNRGTDIPPHRIQRAFYRVLDNAGIERCGVHTLRHTFASILFENKTDIKTVSKLLGHSGTQVTLNTYVHIIEKIDHEAVEKLDNVFGA